MRLTDTVTRMAQPQPVDLDAVFHALSNESRRAMLGRLAAGPLSVGALAAPLPMSLAAASKHIAVLERAGLIERTVLGRRHELRLRRSRLAPAARWIEDAAAREQDAEQEAIAPAIEPARTNKKTDKTVKNPGKKKGKAKRDKKSRTKGTGKAKRKS